MPKAPTICIGIYLLAQNKPNAFYLLHFCPRGYFYLTTIIYWNYLIFFLFGIFIEIAICPASLLTSPASPSSTNFLKNLSIPLEMTQNLLKSNCCHMQKSKIDSFISLMQVQNPLENATCLQYQCLTWSEIYLRVPQWNICP